MWKLICFARWRLLPWDQHWFTMWIWWMQHPLYPHCKSMLVPCGAGLTFVTGPKLHFGGRSTISRPKGGKISDADVAVLSVYARARKLSLFLLPSPKTGMTLAVPLSVPNTNHNMFTNKKDVQQWMIKLGSWELKNATCWMRLRNLRMKFPGSTI